MVVCIQQVREVHWGGDQTVGSRQGSAASCQVKKTRSCCRCVEAFTSLPSFIFGLSSWKSSGTGCFSSGYIHRVRLLDSRRYHSLAFPPCLTYRPSSRQGPIRSSLARKRHSAFNARSDNKLMIQAFASATSLPSVSI